MKPKSYWTRHFHKHMATKTSQFFQRVLSVSEARRIDQSFPQPQSFTHERLAYSDRFEAVQTVADLIQLYVLSASYTGLKFHSRNFYDLYLEIILKKFGSTPLRTFEERGARTYIRQWRDNELASHPRRADATISILRLLLNFGLDEEYLLRNPAADLGYLHTQTRRNVIWSDAQISTFLAKAPRRFSRALLLAIWTGQRQADIIDLKWESYNGRYIMLQPKKSYRGVPARPVKVLVSDELRNVLREIHLEQIALASDPNPKRRRPQPEHILTTSKGIPWSQEGFKGAWRKAVSHAGISGVTFHDLRGTFVTLSHRAGASIVEIAEATGHDEKECERIIRRHYLATAAEPVVVKLAASKSFARDWLNADTKHVELSERASGPRYPRKTTRFEQICAAGRADLES